MTFPERKNFTRAVIAAACRRYGPGVGPLPEGVDGAQLLWAMTGVESSFGANCQPRHEPAFDVGGRYAEHSPMPIWLKRLGPAGACSYGPLQLMICNAPLTYNPLTFDNVDMAFQASVRFLNSQLRAQEPTSLAEIGEVWNTGHKTADPDYERKLAAAYAVAMPAAMEA